MSLPVIMQKGLTALLKVVKLASQEGVLKAVNTLGEHFTLTTYEIARAYQDSYEMALEAISLGLGKPSLFAASVVKEFANQVAPHYLQPFVQHHQMLPSQVQIFCGEMISQCQALLKAKGALFTGDNSTLTETELATLVMDTESLSITQLVLEQWHRLEVTRPQLNDQLVAFLSYNDLLGAAILFFLHERLRQESRVETTLAALQRQELWQDVRELKGSLGQLMTRLDLSAQIKPRDEFTHHNQDSLQKVQDTLRRLHRLPSNHPHYSHLLTMGGSVLSSTGALLEAEKLLLEVKTSATTEAERALASFNLFQVQLRGRAFETALSALQEAIQWDRSRYALHDVEKYPLLQILGAGGMGCVFLCTHKLRKQKVVVKCFWENRKGSAEEVFKEAFAMSDLAGEYVPAPLDYGYVDGTKQERAFFVTEYLDGAIDGETWLERVGKLEVETGLPVALQIAKGLQVAHQAGIWHLDLKPANLLLLKTSAVVAGPNSDISTTLKVKIIDFGLSQVTTPLQQQLLTRSSYTQLSTFGQAVFGTLDYAPPEQQGVSRYGKPSAKSDVFAFGATLYRLLTGDSPRKLNPKRLARAPELFSLLCDCMEEDPHLRPSVAEVITRLEKMSPQRRQPSSPVQHTPLVEKRVELKKPEILTSGPKNEKVKGEEKEEEMSEELRQLLELAQAKFGKGSGYSYSSYLHAQGIAGEATENGDIHVVCPRCDSVFVVSEEGEAHCPHCSGEFEVDEDGDVIYEYEEEEGEEEK